MLEYDYKEMKKLFDHGYYIDEVVNILKIPFDVAETFFYQNYVLPVKDEIIKKITNQDNGVLDGLSDKIIINEEDYDLLMDILLDNYNDLKDKYHFDVIVKLIIRKAYSYCIKNNLLIIGHNELIEGIKSLKYVYDDELVNSLIKQYDVKKTKK